MADARLGICQGKKKIVHILMIRKCINSCFALRKRQQNEFVQVKQMQKSTCAKRKKTGVHQFQSIHHFE